MTCYWTAVSRWKKSKAEIKKYLTTNKNENTIYKNLWDIAKATLEGGL